MVCHRPRSHGGWQGNQQIVLQGARQDRPERDKDDKGALFGGMGQVLLIMSAGVDRDGLSRR